MKIVYRGGEAELIEKKSRFIATLSPAESEEEALEFISATKKKYWDATHNCFAFVIGDNQELSRSSDDGEPQGTAGHPMLDVLLSEGIHNAVVVVTRYFGGTLLGTGGLVRAYSKSVQLALRAGVILDREEGVRLAIRTDYNSVGKIQYLLGQRSCPMLDSSYTDVVVIDALVPAEKLTALRAAVAEATSGRAEFTEETPVSYAFYEGEPILFT